MIETVIAIVKIIAPVSVALIVFAQALKIPPRQITVFFREHPLLMLRALVTMLIIVPASAVAIILLLKPQPAVAIGLAILASCPPAPLMLKGIGKLGRGDTVFVASLHLSVSLLAFITVPFCLYVISIPIGFQVEVDLASMAWVVGRTILFPVGLGLAVRHFYPKFVETMGPRLDRAGTIGLVTVLLVAFAVWLPRLWVMTPYSYLVVAAVSFSALAIGHFLGPADPYQRTTLAVESSVRHPGLALTIASANFSPEKAIPIIVPAVLVCALIVRAYLIRRKMSAEAAQAGAA